MNDFGFGSGGYVPQFDLANFGVPQLPMTAPAGASPGLAGLFEKWGLTDQYNPLGQKTGQGIGGMALGAANGIFNAYMGMKQYGLAKDQFAESKRQFGLNYDAQARTTNAALADRQSARLAGNGGTGYQSVAEYMSKYGIPGG